MNLKEAYRYQNFLEGMMNSACLAIGKRENAVKIEKLHKRNAANTDAQDVTEAVDKTGCHGPAAVSALMGKLVDERKALSHAITVAKAGLASDIDATLDEIKFRRKAAEGLRSLLRHKASKTVERGTDYKFNAEGNQAPYSYEIEVTVSEDFDRATMKASMKAMLKQADELSAEVEKAQLAAVVAYEPPFDVNDSFEDVVAQFEPAETAEA